MSSTIVPQNEAQVKRLQDKPILVCTLQSGVFLLDLNTDEPMRPTDYIPFDGRPCCAANDYDLGLEARG